MDAYKVLGERVVREKNKLKRLTEVELSCRRTVIMADRQPGILEVRVELSGDTYTAHRFFAVEVSQTDRNYSAWQYASFLIDTEAVDLDEAIHSLFHAGKWYRLHAASQGVPGIAGILLPAVV